MARSSISRALRIFSRMRYSYRRKYRDYARYDARFIRSSCENRLSVSLFLILSFVFPRSNSRPNEAQSWTRVNSRQNTGHLADIGYSILFQVSTQTRVSSRTHTRKPGSPSLGTDSTTDFTSGPASARSSQTPQCMKRSESDGTLVTRST